MLMAQAIRPPASPVGSVLSDTHSMNPGNGASSSILPGSEEGIGGQHGFPDTLAFTAIYNEWIETLLSSMLDDTGLRLAVEQAMARPKTAALLPAYQQPSLRRGTSSRSAPRKASPSRLGAHSTKKAIRPRIPRPGSRASGRKCPLAKTTAAAILPTSRVGTTESFCSCNARTDKNRLQRPNFGARARRLLHQDHTWAAMRRSKLHLVASAIISA